MWIFFYIILERYIIWCATNTFRYTALHILNCIKKKKISLFVDVFYFVITITWYFC